MGEKEELFLTVEYQLIYTGENMESESHYFATILVIIGLGKNHQCMCILKLVGESLMRKNIYIVSK